MQDLKSLDQRVTQLHKRYDSVLEFESRRFIPTSENIEELEADIENLEEELAQGGANSPLEAEQVLRAWLQESLEGLKARLINDRAFPNRYVRSLSGEVNSLINLDKRDPSTVSSILVEILKRGPAILQAASELGTRISEDRREMLVKDLQNLSKLCQSLSIGPSGSFSTLGTQKQDQLKEGLTNLAQKAELLSKKVEEAANPSQSDLWSGLDYTNTLARVYGIDINELLGWYRDEVEERKQGLYALAEKIDSHRSPFQILEEDLAHYDSPKEMYQAMKNFLVVARKRSLDYLSLPDGEICEVWKVPEYLKDSYPWGGYYGKHPLRGELEGAVFLNQYNYQDLTEGWLELNAVHECYPGHHAHAVKTAAGDMPLSFKAVSALTSRAAPLTEGVAVRSEKLMQDIFEDDLFPLFVAYRRLHIAVRVWADLLLHYFDKGVESAVQLYRKYMHFSDKISREQVFSQQLTPGYFTVYCYGLKKLQRIQEDSAWTDPEFTELIFSSGKVSLRTIQNLIRLSAEERDMLLNNFTETKTNF